MMLQQRPGNFFKEGSRGLDNEDKEFWRESPMNGRA